MLCVEMGRQYWEELELKVWLLWREDKEQTLGKSPASSWASNPHMPRPLPSELPSPLLDEMLMQSGYSYPPLQMRKPSPKSSATDSIIIR